MPPLGPCYLSAVLKEKGHEVEFIDLAAGQELPDIEADLVGITATTPQFPEAVRILREIKRANPEQKVIIGGPHATVATRECIDAGFDTTVVGEGEMAITLLTKQQVPKGFWTGEIHIRAINRPWISNVDSIPFPDRTLTQRYHYYLGDRLTTTMITSRGCPFNCSFCCKTWPRKVRYRSVDNVLIEAALIRDMGFKGVMIYDDEMCLQWERDHKIFLGLKGLDLAYRIFTRADLVDEKKASLLAATGCYEVLIGIESGSDQVLKNINKGTTRSQNLQAVARLKRHGIKVKAALVVGLPGESPETLRETETFVEQAQPDAVDFTVFTPYPGSLIYQQPERFDIKIHNGSVPYKTAPGKYQSVVSTSKLSADEIVIARDYLEAKFKPGGQK